MGAGWEWNPIDGMFTWSEAHAQLFGLSLGAFEEDLDSFCLRLHPHDRPNFETALIRSRDFREPFFSVYHIRLPDGSFRRLRSAAQILGGERSPAPRLIGFTHAITSSEPPTPVARAGPMPGRDETPAPPHRGIIRPRSAPPGVSRRFVPADSGQHIPGESEKNLALRERYQTIFERMTDGFVLFEAIRSIGGDIDGFNLIEINPAAERILGLARAASLGSPLRHLMPDLEPSRLEEFRQVAVSGRERRFTAHLAARDRHVSVLAFRPRPGQFACILQDITDRRQLEAQFFHAQKMEIVGQLASGVAHDYNNILTSTLLLLGMLLGDSSQPRHMVEALKELEGETKRAARLTRQLLTFSRKHPAQIKPVNLHELLSHLFTMLNRLLGEHIQVEFRGADTPLWIEADAGMIEQVVINLCINARDAMMPAGGRLTLQTALVAIDAAMRRKHPEATLPAYVRLSVTDTGCGMDDATLKRIFEPFFTTKERQHGTGLGLVTVQNITRQHRGWVAVQSRPDAGSTFEIYLPPFAPAAPGNASPARRSADGESLRGGETILLVEDESSVRQTTAASLRAHGYEVIEAGDASTALRCWRQTQRRIDLLLTDMVMPCGVTGMELALQLSREQPELKIIVSSGYNAPAPSSSGAPSINDCYLPKPYDTQTLLATIRQHLDHP